MEIKKADIFLDNLFLYKKYNIILISTKEEYKNEFFQYLKKGSCLLNNYSVLDLSDKDCFIKMGYSNEKYLLPIICNQEYNIDKLETFIKKTIEENFNKFNKQFNSIDPIKLKESVEIILENINAKFIYLSKEERNKLVLRNDYLEKEDKERSD